MLIVIVEKKVDKINLCNRILKENYEEEKQK
jgi:hypothetical protein